MSNPVRWCTVLVTARTRCRLAELREVYPVVLALALPLPFELESVKVYLVRLEDGWLMIDCAMETDAAFETLRAAFELRGIDWSEIRQILATHMHPDHMGMASALLEPNGADLPMHEVHAQHLPMVR